MRPVSIIIPIAATAINAMVVATVPNTVPSSQDTAATNGLEPSGSASDAEVE
jgi:hypothetical protein